MLSGQTEVLIGPLAFWDCCLQLGMLKASYETEQGLLGIQLGSCGKLGWMLGEQLNSVFLCAATSDVLCFWPPLTLQHMWNL